MCCVRPAYARRGQPPHYANWTYAARSRQRHQRPKLRRRCDPRRGVLIDIYQRSLPRCDVKPPVLEPLSGSLLAHCGTGECTAYLTPRVREMLIDAGHCGRQFAPSVRRVLGAPIRQFMPRFDPKTQDEFHPAVPGEEPRKKDFVKFTVPGRELRRLIAEAKVANETFSIQYTVNQACPLANYRTHQRWCSLPSCVCVRKLTDDPNAGRSGWPR